MPNKRKKYSEKGGENIAENKKQKVNKAKKKDVLDKLLHIGNSHDPDAGSCYNHYRL